MKSTDTRPSNIKTATDQTRKHYKRPEVKETILRFCQDGEAWRPLNGDQGWYIGNGRREIRLRSPEDYEDTTKRYRTLYATLDLFHTAVKGVSRSWDTARGAPTEPIGTLRDCLAYTLGADIDSVGDIIGDPAVKQAVEEMAKFLVQKLKKAGVSKSVYCLYSGGGIYVLIHHGLFRTKPVCSPEEIEQAFRSLTGAYNMFLADAETEFFKLHPNHRGKAKIDKINNQKRKFKCIFSIHKKHQLAVIPLERENIKIDFDKAKIPLSDDVLAEGAKWYKEFDIEEKEAMQALLKPYGELIQEDLQRRKKITGNYEISHRSEPLPVERWPPCMRNILEKAEPGKGPHRACAVLAAYLYHAGWSWEEAWKLWCQVADRCGIEDRIFEQWYGQMSCPSCSTIKGTSSGYPKVGLGGLGYCVPDERCNVCKWPGDHNRWSVEELNKQLKEDLSALDNDEVLNALSSLRLLDPLAYSILVKEVKITGEVKKALEREIDRIQKGSEKLEVSPEIHAKAIEILENGDPTQYITHSCSSMVLGAEKAFRKLICCVSVQNVRQSAGLHPKLNGESGGGKTWALLTFAHHLPEEAVVKGSMSAKAGYYHKEGDRVFRILDDYQTGNEDLDTVIKQTSSVFHEPYTHRTVANHKALILQIGSEQTWAITSVDSSQDIQVLNRQIPINVDDSEELTKKVNQRTLERYGEGEPQFPVDDTIRVCREIFRILREDGYINVRVPFHDRIDWMDTSNRRNPSIFMDMLIAHTAMNRYQREKDADGYFFATEGDFHSSKALFVDHDAEELVRRLTKKEREFAELLIKNRGGLMREEVAQIMKLSPSRISHLANGDKGKGGLSQKLPGFCAQEITDYEYLSGGDKRAIRKTLFKLEGYNPLEGFDAVVKLRESAQSADGVRVKVRSESSAEIDNTERDKRDREEESAASAEKERTNANSHFSSRGQDFDQENFFSHQDGKNPHSDQETAAPRPEMERTAGALNRTVAHSESTDSGALHIGPHPIKDLPTPVSKRSTSRNRASSRSKAISKPPEEKETTGEPVQKRDKSTAIDQKCPLAGELVTKYKNSQDSEKELNAKAAIDLEISRLEEAGEPVVPAMIAEKMGQMIPQISAMLSDMDYYQTTKMDKKSYMMIWAKKGSSEP